VRISDIRKTAIPPSTDAGRSRSRVHRLRTSPRARHNLSKVKKIRVVKKQRDGEKTLNKTTYNGCCRRGRRGNRYEVVGAEGSSVGKATRARREAPSSGRPEMGGISANKNGRNLAYRRDRRNLAYWELDACHGVETRGVATMRPETHETPQALGRPSRAAVLCRRSIVITAA